MKLKHFLREKGYIVNHAVKIVKSIVECFYKCYGNTISEMSEASVNVHVDEGIASYLMSVELLTVMCGLI